MNEEVKAPNNTEIDQVLKEFEVKSAEQQNSSYKAVKFYDETDAPKIVRLVMKYSGGAIKEQKIAEYVLLGLVIIMLAVSLYLFFGVNRRPSPPSADKIIWVAGPQNGK